MEGAGFGFWRIFRGGSRGCGYENGGEEKKDVEEDGCQHRPRQGRMLVKLGCRAPWAQRGIVEASRDEIMLGL